METASAGNDDECRFDDDDLLGNSRAKSGDMFRCRARFHIYANNETNYCPVCQTNGKLLADRSLSRLLRSDWPRTLEELEERESSAS